MKFLNLFTMLCFFIVSKSFAQTIYTLDSINTPGFKKIVFNYDQFDRHIQTLSYQFGNQANYELSEITSYVFDNNNNMVEQESFYVQNSVVTPGYKTLLNYNTQGQVSSITNLWYEVASSTYYNSNKTDYIRNTNGDVVSELFFNYQINFWELSGQQTYTYIANNPVERVFQYTIDNGTTFVNSSRQTYTYNPNNFPTEQVDYTWINPTWDPTNKTTYTYDASNNVTQTLNYFMINSTWDENLKEELSYNAVNDFIIYESFSKVGPNWVPEYKKVNSFDAPLLQDLVVPTDFSFNSKLDVEEIFEAIGPAWSLVKTGIYSYSEEITNSVTSINDSKISVYPIPSNDILNILVENDSKQAKIFNSFGKLLLEVNLINGLNQLSLEGLSTGTYFINDETNNLNVRFIVVN